ncbi:MAG: hypothetical protein ACXAD7_22695 [Candidatus Kariarchaeaceae archaeon]|jgi:hypothetical protein
MKRKVLIFTEGTIIMHHSAINLSREDRVQQSLARNNPSLSDWDKYIPIGDAVQKLKLWDRIGLKITYLTSRTKVEEISKIRSVLNKFGFPEGKLLFRVSGEEYKDIIEKVLPDILIEDDCESIGGEKEMSYTHLKPRAKERVKLISVKEFGGIDHLPDTLNDDD